MIVVYCVQKSGKHAGFILQDIKGMVVFTEKLKANLFAGNE